MRLNKRGVALLQVLIIAAVLAGFAALVLRVVTSRSLLARRNQRTVTAQMLIENCMGQVNTHLAGQAKNSSDSDFATSDYNPYSRNLEKCCVTRNASGSSCDKISYVCDLNPYNVTATFISPEPDENGFCTLKYTITDGVNQL